MTGCSVGTGVAAITGGGNTSNCAFTVNAALMVTMQVPVPLHPAPDHPAKVEPAAGAAVNATNVFCA